MAVMFNLDKLNEERPEARLNPGWAKGCIPESPDSFIESLAQRVNREKFRFELVGSNYRPSLIDPHNREAHNRIDTRINNNIYDWNYESQIPQQNMHASPIHEEQPISAEPTVGD